MPAPATPKKTQNTTPAPAHAAAPAPFSATTARRLAALERSAYGTAGFITAAGPQLDCLWLHGSAVALGAGALWRLWSRTRSSDHARLLTTCQRALPTLALSGTYTAALLTPGTSWWEIATPLLAAATAAVAAPFTRSRTIRHHTDRLPAVIAEQTAALPRQQPTSEHTGDPYADGLARMWSAAPSTGETQLTRIRHHTDGPDFEAVIEAPPGQPVPSNIDARTVAAVCNVPVAAVDLADLPDTGPGYRAVRVTPTRTAQDARRQLTPHEAIRTVWADRVEAKTGAAPGMRLADHRLTDDRLVLKVEAADDQMIHLPRRQLTRALRPLGVKDPELVMVESDGIARGVVTVYREHPLITIREATRDDLTMDTEGRIVLGLQHDGRPVRMPLYDPELGAVTDLIVGAPGSGKSVTLNHIIAAERISGVVSIVADAQNGMSLPEARGRTYHFGAGIAAAAATLAAACAVGDYRETVSAQNGWGGFQINDPWPLFNITLDEINRILAQEADVPADFKKWFTGLISHFQLTGRKFGGGLRFAGQSIHLRDLGDAEKIRANAKQGTVWLGRVNSSTTKNMAADMVTDGTDVTPIPKHFGDLTAEVDAAWSGTETPRGPITAGRAWMFQGGRAINMRTFKAIKENRTFPRLIDLYESAPVPRLSAEEDRIFQQAYAQALDAAERLLAGENPHSTSTDSGHTTGETPPQPQPETPIPAPVSAVPAPPRTLADRVLDALANGPLRTREIRTAVGVGTPDGPASGSVDNTLSKLAESGRLTRVGHGMWARPDTNSEQQ
ncbi:hypothetical protein [Streptomyces cacaoi]|uniref:hypothetical protein n=1 Tax=Streptomyces cacaoi TaxID=1898 RepID=UPI0011F103CA|nr:hypothetical protein [Streptomyces cacaoi]